MKNLFFCILLALGASAAVPPSNAKFLKPDEAIAKMDVPEGFEVTAFVAEPDIGERIAAYLEELRAKPVPRLRTVLAHRLDTSQRATSDLIEIQVELSRSLALAVRPRGIVDDPELSPPLPDAFRFFLFCHTHTHTSCQQSCKPAA